MLTSSQQQHEANKWIFHYVAVGNGFLAAAPCLKPNSVRPCVAKVSLGVRQSVILLFLLCLTCHYGTSTWSLSGQLRCAV